MLLGWETVPVTFLKDLSPMEVNEVELEENIQRKDLTWQETVNLKKKLHELKCSLHGEEWTIEDTAKSLGETPRNTQRDLALAKELEKYPELHKEKDKHIARTNARRKNEIETRRTLSIPSNSTQEGEESVIATANDGLYNGDCRDFLPEILSNSIDLILCDPPFGINFGDKDRNKSYSTTYGEFVDNEANVIQLLWDILPELYRVLKPCGHLYLFYGTQHYFQVIQVVERFFYKDKKSNYSNIPLLWIKSSQQNASPYTRFFFREITASRLGSPKATV